MLGTNQHGLLLLFNRWISFPNFAFPFYLCIIILLLLLLLLFLFYFFLMDAYGCNIVVDHTTTSMP